MSSERNLIGTRRTLRSCRRCAYTCAYIASLISQIDRILKEVDALVGVADIKKSMHAIYDTMRANWDVEQSAKSGRTPGEMFMNRVFVGNPGTGKTTVAKLYAKLLCATGMISKNEVVPRTASDFISEAVGGSSQKTKDILKLAEGKALFIDEAYALFDGSAQSSGMKSYGSQVRFLHCTCRKQALFVNELRLL